MLVIFFRCVFFRHEVTSWRLTGARRLDPGNNGHAYDSNVGTEKERWARQKLGLLRLWYAHEYPAWTAVRCRWLCFCSSSPHCPIYELHNRHQHCGGSIQAWREAHTSQVIQHLCGFYCSHVIHCLQEPRPCKKNDEKLTMLVPPKPDLSTDI